MFNFVQQRKKNAGEAVLGWLPPLERDDVLHITLLIIQFF